MFWHVKASVFEREEQDVKRGKAGFAWFTKNLADKQGICYELNFEKNIYLYISAGKREDSGF